MGQYGVPRGKPLWDRMVYQEENPCGAIWCTKRESPCWTVWCTKRGKPCGTVWCTKGGEPCGTVCCRKTLMGQYGVPRGKNLVGQNEAVFSWGICHEVKLPLTVWCTEHLEGKPQQDCMMYPISRGNNPLGQCTKYQLAQRGQDLVIGIGIFVSFVVCYQWSDAAKSRETSFS